MRQNRTLMALIAAGSLLGGSGAMAANTNLSNVCPNPMRMADTGLSGMGSLEDAFGPFQEAFQEHTGLELELYSISNRTAAGNALKYDNVELVFAGPSEFVLFNRQTDAEILFDIQRPQYGTTFLVHADSNIHSLKDLEGKHVALKDVGSTSGHIWPSKMMVEAGLDLDEDVRISMAGDALTQALVNHDVDAMGGGNDDADYIRDELDPDGDYRVIAESETLPGDPVVIRGNLSEACKNGLRQTLKENQEDLWEALVSTERNEEKFFTRNAHLGFELEPEDYQVIAKAYEAAGIELN